jgi:hypothetical protein
VLVSPTPWLVKAPPKIGFVGQTVFPEVVPRAAMEVVLPSKLSDPPILTAVVLAWVAHLKVPASATVAKNTPLKESKPQYLLALKASQYLPGRFGSQRS